VDPLTGLYRPEFFGEALEVELRRVHRYGGEVALVVLDLDDFKQVNDRHGHAAGNEVLRRAGAVLRKAARDSDVAARFGGEELVLLVRGDERSATVAAARVVEGLRDLRFAGGLQVTCSAGVAALAEGGDSAALFASADQALYEAKRRGKNRVVVARRAPAVDERRRRTA
jgi:diguanylate cyclase (GGDEF)-like protein